MFYGDLKKSHYVLFAIKSLFFLASPWCSFRMALLNVREDIEWGICIFVDKHKIFRIVTVCHWLTIIFKFKFGGIRYLFSPSSYSIIIICIIFITFIFMPYHCEKLSASLFPLKVVLLFSVKILKVIEYIVQTIPSFA